MSLHAFGVIRCLHLLAPLILLSVGKQDGAAFYSTAISAIAINTFVQLECIKLNYHVDSFVDCMRMDHRLHDIPLDEENQSRCELPRQDVRFDTWSYHRCYSKTSFRKDQLKRIYKQFGLKEIADANDGVISVYKGTDKRTGRPLYYNFHPEELFLFFMTKCRHGYTNKELCDDIFGGDQSRWSYGWPWIVHYLDIRYQDIIGHQGLARFVDDFPRFHEAIQQKAMKDKPQHRHNNTGLIHPGLRFLPFDAFAWVDCTIFRCRVANTGPDGDYIGAPRKEGAFFSNRALYTKWKKLHGSKLETVHLPNGIQTLFGPVSARPNDVGEGVLMMSGLDDFLFEIQQRKPYIYSLFGDSVYGMAGLRCIRSYFKAFGRNGRLTDYQITCNKRMKAMRQSIEWGYGDLGNIFTLCDHPRNFKLGNPTPYAQKQLRVCLLLLNIYTCLNGNKSCGYKTFNCPPPTLEWYLDISQ